MKITRRQLKKMILNEIRILNESLLTFTDRIDQLTDNISTAIGSGSESALDRGLLKKYLKDMEQLRKEIRNEYRAEYMSKGKEIEDFLKDHNFTIGHSGKLQTILKQLRSIIRNPDDIDSKDYIDLSGLDFDIEKTLSRARTSRKN